MTDFNHAYSFAFEVVSNTKEGETVTGRDLRQTIINKLNNSTDDDIADCCGGAWDTYEVEE